MPRTNRPNPRTNGRARVAASSWLVAYYEEMDPWFHRADVAIALSRELRGADGPDDGSCAWCGRFGAHADGCRNETTVES